MNKSGSSLIFANHVENIQWESIDNYSKQCALNFLHDSIAVGISGVSAPHSESVFAAASGWGQSEGPSSSILGRKNKRLPAPSAAFVNAFQIHGQEYDCVHEAAVVHPLATIVAVLLAEAERSGPYDGQLFLSALCAGVDVSVALGLAATSPLKFFRPATAGIFGCVAALSKLRGANIDQTINGFGHALAFASGSMQAHLEGLPTLPIQIAAAARSAIQAVDLAMVGVPGPQGAIDGPFGYLALFEDRSDISLALKDLASRRRIGEVSWKPFPTGRAAHGGIVAVQRLIKEHGLSSDSLERFVYSAPPLIQRLVGRPALEGMTPAYARLCLPYLAALTLRFGTVGLNDFSPDRLNDPLTHSLAQKIQVVVNDNQDPAAFTPALATAVRTDGSVVTVQIDAQLGSPNMPLTYDEHLTKARACLAFAHMEDRHEALIEAIQTLPQSLDVGRSLSCALYS